MSIAWVWGQLDTCRGHLPGSVLLTKNFSGFSKCIVLQPFSPPYKILQPLPQDPACWVTHRLSDGWRPGEGG